jgi:PAS domain S-box-containing protein
MVDETNQESLPKSGTGTRPRLDVIPLHSTDLLTLLDARGVVRYESPSIERLYGYDQDELVGESVADYFHPEDRERVVRAFESIVASEDHRVESVEYRHLQADGSYRWIESVASTNPTPDGHYVVNSRDVSGRKERERELERTREQVRSERDGKEAIRKLLLETSGDGATAENVCRLLVDSYGYEAAWVVRDPGDHSNGDTDPTWVTTYGSDRGFRTAVGGETRRVDRATSQVLSAGESVTVTVDTDHRDGIGDRLRECGLYSVRSVPLKHEGISWGALTTVRTTEGSEFSHQLVGELGTALGFRRRIDRQRDALAAETVTELTIRIGSGHVLAALSTSESIPEGAELVAEELRRDGATTYLLGSEDVAADGLAAAVRGRPGLGEVSTVAESTTAAVVRLQVDGPTVGRLLDSYGGVLQSTTARDGRVTITAEFPPRTDVGAVVDTFSEHWPDAAMHARNDRVARKERAGPFASLTKKQEDALRAATLAGFFERPQRASAEDVADTLGVSSSTFLHHLRNAERTVFSAAFAGDPAGE